MTENKRYSFNWERGHPNFFDNHCDLADCYLTCEDVVDRLNELHEENQVLEEQYADDCNEANSMTVKISELTEENEQLKRSVLYSYDEYKRIVNNYVDKIKEVEKENDELKSTIAQLIEQNRKNNDLLQSDIRILEKALWCSDCRNDYGRLKELRKEFMR